MGGRIAVEIEVQLLLKFFSFSSPHMWSIPHRPPLPDRGVVFFAVKFSYPNLDGNDPRHDHQVA